MIGGSFSGKMGKFSGNGEPIFMEDVAGIWEGMQGGGV